MEDEPVEDGEPQPLLVKEDVKEEPGLAKAGAKRARQAGKERKPKATFARRYRPEGCVFAGRRWDCMRDSFDLLIRCRVMQASRAEVPRLQLTLCG